jgi:DNA-binding response OmpR family regulator
VFGPGHPGRSEIKRLSPAVRTLPARDSSSRSPHAQEGKVVVGDIEFDWTKRQVRRMGRSMRLSPKEFYLLGMLMSNIGRMFTREDIHKVIWWRRNVELRTVDATIARLRRAINRGNLPDPIYTVLGFGYKFREDFARECAHWHMGKKKKWRLPPRAEGDGKDKASAAKWISPD